MHVGMAQNPAEFTGLEERVQGDQNGSHTRHGQPGHQPVRAIGHQDRHPGPLADAPAKQAFGQAGGLLLRLPVGQAPLVEDDHLTVAVGLGQAADENRDRRRKVGKGHRGLEAPGPARGGIFPSTPGALS